MYNIYKIQVKKKLSSIYTRYYNVANKGMGEIKLDITKIKLVPAPNRVRSRRKLNLSLSCGSFCPGLGALVLTWARFGLDERKSKQVWPPNPSQRKLCDLHSLL